jgi:predicted transcriptional regulator
MAAGDAERDYLNLTAQIVAAHVGNNTVAADGVAKMIREVYATIRELGQGPAASVPVPRPVPRPPYGPAAAAAPAVNPQESVFPEFIICLEDGRKLKTLRRHLSSAYKMTPEQYRAKWNLDANYPMVAPNYSRVRAELAREAQLGGSSKEATPAAVAPRQAGTRKPA